MPFQREPRQARPARERARARASAPLLLLSLVLLCWLIVPLANARPLDDLTKLGRITIFVYKNYQPYSWIEDGEVRGIDADLARAIADELRLTLDFMVREADENVDDDLRVNIWKGDIIERKAADLMLHVPYDRALETRSESLAVLFNPYFDEGYAVLFDPARIAKVETFGSFVTRPIGVELDTAADFFLSNAFRGQLLESIRRGRTFLDVVEAVETGEVGAAMMTLAQAQWLQAQLADRGLQIAQPPMPGIVRTRWPIGMAVKHDSRDLGYEVGAVMEKLLASGELAAIFARYGVDYRPARLE